MAKKTSVKISGVGEAKNNALKFINQQTKDKQFLNEIAKEAVTQIQKRTQAGLEDYKQKPLTESTIISREILAEANTPGNFFKKNRSNLTMTGQLLESIIYAVQFTTSEITIKLNPFRRKNVLPQSIGALAGSKPKKKQGQYYALYETMKKEKNPNKTNPQIQKDLKDKGREFLFLSSKVNQLLESKIAQQLRRKLALYNKVFRKLK